MKIYEYVPGKSIIDNTAIALGFFDGVHKGHRLLLKTTRNLAREKNLTFTVFTFRSENSFKTGGSIYSTDEKLEIFESLGVEAVILADFASVASISAEDFVRSALVKDMGCHAAVAGYDFRFGNKAAGNAELLKSILTELGAACVIEEEQQIDGGKISTTAIKELLLRGDVKNAKRYLETPYFITATVTHGNGVGRKLGFPTVNTSIPLGRTVMKRGVYRTAVAIDDKLYSSVTNVGVCPTFDEREAHTETYILDYSGDLYGKKIRIFFLDYLREEIKFKDPKSLVLQINVDINRVLKENGELKWQEIGLSLPQ